MNPLTTSNHYYFFFSSSTMDVMCLTLTLTLILTRVSANDYHGGETILTDHTSNTNDCISYSNPNHPSIPMVNPPLELVGSWNGTNCGIDDEAPTRARLEMEQNGTNVWYFNDIPQTGAGVEAVVGWHCIDVGVGYWWGQVANSNVTWCNLFQYSRTDTGTGEDVYINWAYGGEGQFAQPQGFCPTHLDTNPDLLPLQATFVRVPSGGTGTGEIDSPSMARSSSSTSGSINRNTVVMSSCNVPASRPIEEQPRCHSLFVAHELPIPDPFRTRSTIIAGSTNNDDPADSQSSADSFDARNHANEESDEDDENVKEFLLSLPAIDKVTCKAIALPAKDASSGAFSHSPVAFIISLYTIASCFIPMLIM